MRLLLISHDETMRNLLTLITHEEGFEVTVLTTPDAALQMLETVITPMILLFDVWLDAWDAGAQANLAHYLQLPAQHACIVLWDAHIPLPTPVRAQLAALDVTIVKKPVQLDALDAALAHARDAVKARLKLNDTDPNGPETSLPPLG